MPCEKLNNCYDVDVGYNYGNNVLPIYVGDNRTDEDAFKVILQAIS